MLYNQRRRSNDASYLQTDERMIKMKKLYIHNLNIDDLIKTVEACAGEVFLETEEGDSLNLKSTFCRIIGLAKILEGAKISEAYIRCTDIEDETLFFRLNLYHEVPENN